VFLAVLAPGAVAGRPASLPAQVRSAPTLTLDAAKTVVAAAEAEAGRRGWTVAIAVSDPAGELIAFHRLDGVQAGSIDIALAKARTAARMRRPTKALADGIAEGRLGLLTVDGLVALEGGLPVVIDEQVVGAVGVSGMTGEQDAVIAQAGIDALLPAARR
jgi:uncharacterized protein GlcG (DUF336 family)